MEGGDVGLGDLGRCPDLLHSWKTISFGMDGQPGDVFSCSILSTLLGLLSFPASPMLLSGVGGAG